MQKYEWTSGMLHGIFSFHFCLDTLDIFTFHLSYTHLGCLPTCSPPSPRYATELFSSRSLDLSVSPCDGCFVSLRARPLPSWTWRESSKQKQRTLLPSPVVLATNTQLLWCRAANLFSRFHPPQVLVLDAKHDKNLESIFFIPFCGSFSHCVHGPPTTAAVYCVYVRSSEG